MEISERIRILAKNKGLTIAKLEKKLVFGNGTIRNWDKNSPSIEKVTKVADFFKVSTDYLLGRTNNPNLYILKGNSLPDVFKPFKKLNREFAIEFFNGNNGNSPEERKKAMEDDMKACNALDNLDVYGELLELLPDNMKNKPISVYDLLYTIGNDEEAVKKYNNNFLDEGISTLAAHRTDGYEDDLPEEAQAELQNYIDYLKVKYKKKDAE